MDQRTPEQLQSLVDDEDLDGLLQVVAIDEVAEAWCRYTQRREDDSDGNGDPDWWAIEFFLMRPIFGNGRVYRLGLRSNDRCCSARLTTGNDLPREQPSERSEGGR